ncbi:MULTISPECIES: SigE family RNA polymerase sigma factor [Actinomadura]|uniref:SigE family RNA polymerase sigma factor n=1 Tax=Actinomadura yumaensis TaxID=111807 RepID=A0ABW2CW00_9ACTN|nr:SigE family RNA polymerase sigma factor [Actinomadura sp. J1-007]MWK40222.1 SigE family RNA polymerase sigma factor [Actinomadura sp. J1-007]
MERVDTPLAEPAGAAEERVTALFRRHRLALLRLAVLLVGDEPTAEDVVQDAFMGLHRRWAGLEDEGKALAYARASVVNGSRSVLRRRSVARRFGIAHEPPIWSAESEAILGEDRRRVMEALRRLPRRRREVLVLRFYAGLGDAEIAEALGIAPVTVRTTAARGLTALARLLGNEE